MQLIGSMLSPFTRRVSVTLNHHGMSYELKPLKVMSDLAEIETMNPMGRVPILVLADGEILIDSHAILDHIDEAVGPDHALIPASGRPRRDALRVLAMGHTALEKTVLSFYERVRRPQEFCWADGVARYDAQTVAGLKVFDDLAKAAADANEPWLTPAGKMMQVDILAVVLWDFVGTVNPDLRKTLSLPALQTFAEEKNAMTAFVGTQPG